MDADHSVRTVTGSFEPVSGFLGNDNQVTRFNQSCFFLDGESDSPRLDEKNFRVGVDVEWRAVTLGKLGDEDGGLDLVPTLELHKSAA